MSSKVSKPIIIIGGGGHASVLLDILLSQKKNVIAIASPENLSERMVFTGIPQLLDDDVLTFSPKDIVLVNGIGFLPGSGLKKNLNQYYLSQGYQFETVIAETAQVSPFAKISTGSQILSGAIIQAGTKIGAHSIINTGVIIEHDCDIGSYNHIATGAKICGQVTTMENNFIGAGSTIIQNITLNENVVVAAGAIVTKSILPNLSCYPSRSIF